MNDHKIPLHYTICLLVAGFLMIVSPVLFRTTIFPAFFAQSILAIVLPVIGLLIYPFVLKLQSTAKIVMFIITCITLCFFILTFITDLKTKGWASLATNFLVILALLFYTAIAFTLFIIYAKDYNHAAIIITGMIMVLICSIAIPLTINMVQTQQTKTVEYEKDVAKEIEKSFEEKIEKYFIKTPDGEEYLDIDWYLLDGSNAYALSIKPKVGKETATAIANKVVPDIMKRIESYNLCWRSLLLYGDEKTPHPDHIDKITLDHWEYSEGKVTVYYYEKEMQLDNGKLREPTNTLKNRTFDFI